jgi:hypothetical protein
VKKKFFLPGKFPFWLNFRFVSRQLAILKGTPNISGVFYAFLRITPGKGNSSEIHGKSCMIQGFKATSVSHFWFYVIMLHFFFFI